MPHPNRPLLSDVPQGRTCPTSGLYRNTSTPPSRDARICLCNTPHSCPPGGGSRCRTCTSARRFSEATPGPCPGRACARIRRSERPRLPLPERTPAPVRVSLSRSLSWSTSPTCPAALKTTSGCIGRSVALPSTYLSRNWLCSSPDRSTTTPSMDSSRTRWPLGICTWFWFPSVYSLQKSMAPEASFHPGTHRSCTAPARTPPASF